MKSAPDIPVVVLTALRNTEIEAQLAKFKVRRVLHKPISEEDLQAAINEILGT